MAVLLFFTLSALMQFDGARNYTRMVMQQLFRNPRVPSFESRQHLYCSIKRTSPLEQRSELKGESPPSLHSAFGLLAVFTPSWTHGRSMQVVRRRGIWITMQRLDIARQLITRNLTLQCDKRFNEPLAHNPSPVPGSTSSAVCASICAEIYHTFVPTSTRTRHLTTFLWMRFMIEKPCFVICECGGQS